MLQSIVVFWTVAGILLSLLCWNFVSASPYVRQIVEDDNNVTTEGGGHGEGNIIVNEPACTHIHVAKTYGGWGGGGGAFNSSTYE